MTQLAINIQTRVNKMKYFYASQIRQYRLQFIRAFSNFYVNFGTEDTPDLKRVPCRYGDASRIAQQVVRGNSENKVLSTPFISCIINGIAMAADRRQDPLLVEKIQVNERLYDEEQQRYTQDIGNRYTVERYMPVPYDLTMQVDIWTNNENVKEQLVEQIFTLYNPAVDFQTSNNSLDWTVLSYIEMQENITWTSRSIPVGTENPIDVLTITFKVPIWINPPAKVKKQAIIQEIITNIIQGTKDENDWTWSEYEFLSRTIQTPGNHSIELNYTGNYTYEISLLSNAGDPIDHLNLPTVTSSKANPTLIVGTSFYFNNVKLEINTSNLSTFVDYARNRLTDSSYSVQLYNKNSLHFVNNSGGDNVFTNDIGNALHNLGLEEAVYPGGKLAWQRLFERYGQVKEFDDIGANASQLRIIKSGDIDDHSKDLSGWISFHPTNQNLIIWKVDTESLPRMTLAPVNAIINPQTKGPASGLPAAALGQRYLLINKPSVTSAVWGNLDAEENDIIEFNGSAWQVSFSATNNKNNIHFVTNLFTGKIYKWNENGWELYIEQMYKPGYWRLSL